MNKVKNPRVQRMNLWLSPPCIPKKTDIEEGYGKAHTANEGEQISNQLRTVGITQLDVGV